MGRSPAAAPGVTSHWVVAAALPLHIAIAGRLTAATAPLAGELAEGDPDGGGVGAHHHDVIGALARDLGHRESVTLCIRCEVPGDDRLSRGCGARRSSLPAVLATAMPWRSETPEKVSRVDPVPGVSVQIHLRVVADAHNLACPVRDEESAPGGRGEVAGEGADRDGDADLRDRHAGAGGRRLQALEARVGDRDEALAAAAAAGERAGVGGACPRLVDIRHVVRLRGGEVAERLRGGVVVVHAGADSQERLEPLGARVAGGGALLGRARVVDDGGQGGGVRGRGGIAELRRAGGVTRGPARPRASWDRGRRAPRGARDRQTARGASRAAPGPCSPSWGRSGRSSDWAPGRPCGTPAEARCTSGCCTCLCRRRNTRRRSCTTG